MIPGFYSVPFAVADGLNSSSHNSTLKPTFVERFYDLESAQPQRQAEAYRTFVEQFLKLAKSQKPHVSGEKRTPSEITENGAVYEYK